MLKKSSYKYTNKYLKVFFYVSRLYILIYVLNKKLIINFLQNKKTKVKYIVVENTIENKRQINY